MTMAIKVDYNIIITSAIIVTAISLISSKTIAATVPGLINIVNLGAIADGKTDSTLLFQSAWASACSSSKPGERCSNKAINFRIDGTLLAPTDYEKSSIDVRIKFEKATKVSISGGTLDGRGTNLWACKASSSSCPTSAAISLMLFRVY
uniref:Uncharacterized protein n=1 Tax=Lactuca sativa TaxID=4236 RepID=A0A9R1XVK0_LACSA|nr:hypothetical protein LSAT_V11C100030800 [Lactuca sativa]